MPQRRAGIKDLRKNRARKMHNLDLKSDLKKTIKQLLTSIQEKKKDEAQATLRLVFKKLDKASKRNILHKNTVGRRKSRFSKLLKNLA